MIAKLKRMEEIIRTSETVKKNNHYWKFYYTDKPALGFRDFYLKYWKGDRLVDIKPKKDRKKNIIPGKFEVYGKRGNYVFTAYREWFECTYVSSGLNTIQVLHRPPEKKEKGRDIARRRALVNLSWNDLFEI